MKTSERHRLKDNDLALAIGQAGDYAARNRRTLTMAVATIVLVAVAAIAFFAWRSNVDGKARAALAEAMVVSEARVVAATPPTPGTDVAPAPPAPGTYPTQKAKLEAALPKFLAAGDGYSGSDAGKMARYHAAVTLVALGRYDEAIKQYDQLAGDNGLLGQSARMGKAEAQLAAGQHDVAISAFKELSEKGDVKMPKEAILLELARAYKIAGKTEDARKTLNQIVEQHADSPFAAAAKTELEKIKS